MRYSLRSVMIVAALGPLVLAGAILLLFSSRQPLVLIAIVAAVAIITWISYWPERRFRAELAKREPLDDRRFFRDFYAATDVPEDIPRRLKPIYCKFFNIEITRLRPHDRPPEVAELETVDLIRDIETEFGLTILDQDLEGINGSFDSVVRYLAKRRAEN